MTDSLNHTTASMMRLCLFLVLLLNVVLFCGGGHKVKKEKENAQKIREIIKACTIPRHVASKRMTDTDVIRVCIATEEWLAKGPVYINQRKPMFFPIHILGRIFSS